MSVMFECKGLTKKYGNKVALNHVDLSLESGRIVGLLGPNGSGKTTMLKLANGLLTPTDGGI
ncbi:MAG: ATP-binding cassette domain-containing protein, partial [Solobacterium sp.]|nr:ATP-binding cassette domain-containing protein [Solobacterium sp.]